LGNLFPVSLAPQLNLKTRSQMNLKPKIVVNQLAVKIAISMGVLFLACGFYFVNHSSAQRVRNSEPGGAKLLTKQPSTDSGEKSPALNITSVTQHGRIVEIQGSTDPGAVIMINGQDVPTLFSGNSFRHFIGPLHAGTTIVSVTAQDSQGGVNTQQMAFTIR
jgi:hypothetical protein